MNKIDPHYFETRDKIIDGQSPWVWPSEDGAPGSDGGAWQGPMDDWNNHHKANILKYVKKFEVVIQAGGACGMYPRLYAQMFDVVYTFEPDPENFYCLVNNCLEKNVIKIQGALIHEHQMLSVDQNVQTNVGMNTVRSDKKFGMIPGFRIDDLALESLDLIHLDVEGCEIYALAGAANMIMKHKPVLMLERGVTQQIQDLLHSLKYAFKEMSVQDAIWMPE